mgnify:CR=1 FL=1
MSWFHDVDSHLSICRTALTYWPGSQPNSNSNSNDPNAYAGANASGDRNYFSLSSLNPLTYDASATASNDITLYGVILAALELVCACAVIVIALKQRRLARRSSGGGGGGLGDSGSHGGYESLNNNRHLEAIVFPMYLNILYFIAFVCLAQGLLDVLLPVSIIDFTSAGSASSSGAGVNPLANSVAHSLCWAVVYSTYTAIAVLLCCRGVGRRSATTALTVALAWGAVTAVAHFLSFYYPATLLLSLLPAAVWAALALAFNLLCLTMPTTVFPRRPAVIAYAAFWSFSSSCLLASALLRFFSFNLGYCFHALSTHGVLALAAPFAAYVALLADSRYWVGLSAAAAQPRVPAAAKSAYATQNKLYRTLQRLVSSSQQEHRRYHALQQQQQQQQAQQEQEESVSGSSGDFAFQNQQQQQQQGGHVSTPSAGGSSALLTSSRLSVSLSSAPRGAAATPRGSVSTPAPYPGSARAVPTTPAPAVVAAAAEATLRARWKYDDSVSAPLHGMQLEPTSARALAARYVRNIDMKRNISRI